MLPNLQEIRKIVESNGFWINEKKIIYRRKHQKQIVTGLLVNEKVNIQKRDIRIIWTHLHFALKFGPLEHIKHRNLPKSNFRDWIKGKICFINAIRPEIAIEMFETYDKINWIELEYPELQRKR
jgi:hypothetical protein